MTDHRADLERSVALLQTTYDQMRVQIQARIDRMAQEKPGLYGQLPTAETYTDPNNRGILLDALVAIVNAQAVLARDTP